jgi:hypothetical protein
MSWIPFSRDRDDFLESRVFKKALITSFAKIAGK